MSALIVVLDDTILRTALNENMLDMYLLLLFLSLLNINNNGMDTTDDSSFWVLREFYGTTVYIQFVDLNNKVAYADDYVVELDIRKNLIELGNGVYEYTIEDDIMVIKNEPIRYVFKRYHPKTDETNTKKIFDAQWLLRGTGFVFCFKDRLITSRDKRKQMQALSDEHGLLNGEWLTYDYKGVTVLRYRLPQSKDDFLVLDYVNEDNFEAYRWNPDNQAETLWRFDNLHVD